MTIPTLVSKYQKHTYVTGLKKAYSTLSNAMALAMHDDEVWVDDYVNPKMLISKYMKVVKTCDRNNYTECSEFCYDGYRPVLGGGKVFVVADGMSFGSSYDISVDVNGNKEPNRWGRDIFGFHIASNNQNGIAAGTILPFGSKQYAQYYNNDSLYWNNNKSLPSCTTDRVNSSVAKDPWHEAACTGRVLEEGAMNY